LGSELSKSRSAQERAGLDGTGILDQVHDAVISTDLEGVIQTWNPAATRIYGREASEAIGRPVEILYPEADRASIRSRIIEPLLREGALETVVRNCHRSGRTIHVTLRLSVLRDAAGEPCGLVGCSNDISEQKRSTDALSRERTFSDRLLETARCIVLVLDPEGRVVRFNRFMEELSGYRSEEVRGLDWFEHFLVDEEWPRIREIFRKAIHGQSTRGNVNRIRMKDGSEREISWWDAPILDPDGNVEGLLSVGHDVTEQRAAQERLMLSERLAAIGQTMAILAHEARNELDLMALGLHTLAESPLQPEAARGLEQLKGGHARLAHLFEEVRSFAAPIRLDPARQDLAGSWRLAWGRLLKIGRDAKLRERIDGKPLICRYDAYRMERVFRNLFENSLAACPDPMAIEIEVGRVEEEGRSCLRISVRDDGPGFDPTQRDRVFDPFFTTKQRGTGLGLALARRIVEAHGGRIAFGEPGVAGRRSGAELLITLPVDGPPTGA